MCSQLIRKDGRKVLLAVSEEPGLRVGVTPVEASAAADEVQFGATGPIVDAATSAAALKKGKEKVSFDRLLLRWTDEWESWLVAVKKARVDWKFISANTVGGANLNVAAQRRLRAEAAVAEGAARGAV